MTLAVTALAVMSGHLVHPPASLSGSLVALAAHSQALRAQTTEADNTELRAEVHAVADDMELLVRENQATSHQLARAEEAVRQLEGDLAKVSSQILSQVCFHACSGAGL